MLSVTWFAAYSVYMCVPTPNMPTHVLLYLIAGHQSLFNFEIGMFSLLEQLQACQLIFHPKHPNEYVHHAYSTCMILVYFVAAYVT